MSDQSIKLVVHGDDRPTARDFTIGTLIIAGWTGRDAASLEAHIVELEELGVTRPNAVPMFYRVDAGLLTTAGTVQMVGREASGEVESVLIKQDGELFVGVGSDHTDRKLETVGITLSKQLCAKPIADQVWRWADVAGHWDSIMLRSHLPASDEPYQQGPTTALRRPDELLAIYEERHGPVPDGTAMFCGTLPAEGGIRFAPAMLLELHDPVLGRTIAHSYVVDVLPIAED
ncbi:MAG: hypothetical protein JWL91_2567 [Sphingomonas bacterium]|nr:DUF2848 domain-containing protein [Sphingomonas bacterium]MDB5690691.1 hypothetical protein [Sphingomonas bacterium]